MKNLDVKKLLVLLGIVVVVIGGIFLVKNLGKGGKAKADDIETVEDLAVTYFANLSQGYSTAYSGIDVLYSNDKTTINDITYGAVLNTAIKYAQKNGIVLSVPQNIINGIKAIGKYEDVDTYYAYDATVLDPIIEKLFGKDVFKKTTNVINYLYEYVYVSENNVYLIRKNKEMMDYTDPSYRMDCSIVKTVKEKDLYKTTIAVAYVFNNGTATYYKDVKMTEEIASGVDSFPKNKVKEFNQYTITMKKTSDGNYIFESVEKN